VEIHQIEKFFFYLFFEAMLSARVAQLMHSTVYYVSVRRPSIRIMSVYLSVSLYVCVHNMYVCVQLSLGLKIHFGGHLM